MKEELNKRQCIVCKGFFSESFISSLTEREVDYLGYAVSAIVNHCHKRKLHTYVFTEGTWFDAMISSSIWERTRNREDYKLLTILPNEYKSPPGREYDEPSVYTEVLHFGGKLSMREYDNKIFELMGGLVYFGDNVDQVTAKYVAEAQRLNIPMIDLRRLWATYNHELEPSIEEYRIILPNNTLTDKCDASASVGTPSLGKQGNIEETVPLKILCTITKTDRREM